MFLSHLFKSYTKPKKNCKYHNFVINSINYLYMHMYATRNMYNNEDFSL